jgi:O-antigen/teichoic acid export membrane protein
LNWALIPLLGVFGAGLATGLSLMANFFVSMYYSQKYYRVPILWRQIILGSVFTLCAVGLGLTMSTISWWSILLKILIVLAAVGLLVRVGLVRIDEVRALLNRMKVYPFVGIFS